MRAADSNRRITSAEFTYRKCGNCGLLFLENVPADLGTYYPRQYYSIPERVEDLKQWESIESYKLEILQQHLEGGRVLEIGPAWGTFAWLAKRAGYKVEVIEMDRSCCEFIGSSLGIKAHNSDSPARVLDGLGAFDAIVSWQNIEHLPDFWSVMRGAAARLRAGGLLVVSTPNPESLQFRLFGRLWAHLDAPRHVCLIPAGALRRYLGTLGLDPVTVTCTDRGSIGWNSFGWAVSLGNLWNNAAWRKVMFVVGRMVCKAVAPIERRGMRGASYTAVFRRR